MPGLAVRLNQAIHRTGISGLETLQLPQLCSKLQADVRFFHQLLSDRVGELVKRVQPFPKGAALFLRRLGSYALDFPTPD
jgi:hypothetical protein